MLNLLLKIDNIKVERHRNYDLVKFSSRDKLTLNDTIALLGYKGYYYSKYKFLDFTATGHTTSPRYVYDYTVVALEKAS